MPSIASSRPAPVSASPVTTSSSSHARGRHALGRAGEAAHGVALAGERRRERGADVARDAGDEDLHPHTLPYGPPAKTAQNAGSPSRRQGCFRPVRGYLRGSPENRAVCGFRRCAPVPGALCLRSSSRSRREGESGELAARNAQGEGELRRVLLRSQRTVRTRTRRAVRDVPPDHPEGLRPPSQLRFVFRQERRRQAAWAFPTAQEQAALHAVSDPLDAGRVGEPVREDRDEHAQRGEVEDPLVALESRREDEQRELLIVATPFGPNQAMKRLQRRSRRRCPPAPTQIAAGRATAAA